MLRSTQLLAIIVITTSKLFKLFTEHKCVLRLLVFLHTTNYVVI